MTDRTAEKGKTTQRRKSDETIIAVFIIPHQSEDLAAEGGGAGQGADSGTNKICYRVSSLAPAYIPPLSRGS